MSEIKLLSCPFCGGEAILRDCSILGWEANCKDENCIGYTTSIKYQTQEEAIEKWNTRKPMERIVERLKKERIEMKEEREEAIEYEDEQIVFATNNQIRAFDYSLRVIKEEGGLE